MGRQARAYAPKPAAPRKHGEHEEQVALFDWAALRQGRYPELRLLHAIPNGGKRDKFVAIQLQREGLKPGVPDVCLPVARGGWHGLYIELKWAKNKPTDHQLEWLEALTAQGYLAVVCYGWQEAVEVIEDYLGRTDDG